MAELHVSVLEAESEAKEVTSKLKKGNPTTEYTGPTP